MRDIRPIRTDKDLAWALKEIEPYSDSQPPIGSVEGKRFDVLAALIVAYEDRHFPEPGPIDFLRIAKGMT